MKSFFLCAIIFAFALAGHSTLILEGRVVIKGNEPHTIVVLITRDNREYSIVGKYSNEIRLKYQNHTIRVEGRIRNKAAGPGFPAEFEVTRILESKNQ